MNILEYSVMSMFVIAVFVSVGYIFHNWHNGGLSEEAKLERALKLKITKEKFLAGIFQTIILNAIFTAIFFWAVPLNAWLFHVVVLLVSRFYWFKMEREMMALYVRNVTVTRRLMEA